MERLKQIEFSYLPPTKSVPLALPKQLMHTASGINQAKVPSARVPKVCVPSPTPPQSDNVLAREKTKVQDRKIANPKRAFREKSSKTKREDGHGFKD
jgi:hypothetical protein